MANLDIVQLLEPVCPACRRPLVPHGPRLGPLQMRIFEAVQAHGAITPTDLRDRVWANDENGGPLNPKVLTAHVWVLKPERPHGIAVHAGKGAGAVYTIQKAR